MPIDTRYIPAFNLENTFIDKDTGEPMAGGQIYFYQDNQRATLKNVWQISGSSPNYTFTQLPNPITLSSIGTIQDSLGNPVIPYFLPEDSNGETELYFVSVENADGVFQFSREAVPHVDESADSSESISFSNELSNPQFVEVSFNPDNGAVDYTFSGASLKINPIAPDWDMIVSGTGTVSVERIAYAGTVNRPTNPPYFLRLMPTGSITLLQLRQRLHGSPNLWAGENVSSMLVGRTLAGDASFTMSYIDSSGNTDVELLADTFPSTGAFDTYTNVKAIPVSTSPDTAPDAYIDIIIDLPATVSVELTSIQIVGVGDGTTDIAFDQTTQNRQIDQLFHHYQNELIIKPKDSILTAWNFALNPWQFRSSGLSNLTSNSYVADQTIVVTENSNSVQVGKTNSPVGLLDIRSRVGVSQGRVAIIQYVDPSTISQYWGATLSSLARMRITTSSGTQVPVKMRVIESTTKPTAVNPIASWGGVDPVFTAQWSALVPDNDPAYVLPNNWDPNQRSKIAPPFSFNGFKTTSKSTSTATLGIVLYTTVPMSSASQEQWLINSVSLVPNEFAVEANPETFDSVLRECQFYYEKSYPLASIPGSATTLENVISKTHWIKGGSFDTAFRFQFQLEYEQVKRTQPTVTLYSPASTTSNRLQFGVRRELTYPSPVSGANPTDIAVIANPGWAAANSGRQRKMFYTNSATPVMLVGTPQADDEIELLFHYVADARLGLVP